LTVSGDLLAWYDRHHRDLPWRVPPAALAAGVQPDPYHVWLSEVMLQQTTVEAVKPYFRTFLATWPTVDALAAAPVEDVMRAWAGLGYYSRARNLKACAAAVAALPAGFPDTEDRLRALPGVGAYTAAAIAAIAFGRPAAVVDGNVERVTTRLFDIRTPLPEAKPAIKARVAAMLPADRPGDFAQAMMDLGATICTPKRPRCMLCPVQSHCAGFAAGDPELLPVKPPKPEKSKRRGVAYVALRDDGAILMRTRADKGLLGGMTEIPNGGWNARIATEPEAPPLPGAWRSAGQIVHVFTHFELTLGVMRADIAGAAAPAGHRWVAADDVPGEALPTVMKKAIEVAVPGATQRRMKG
jgi:A/G-specific adenine glycosylase